MQKLIYYNENGDSLELGHSWDIILEHMDLGEVAVEKQSTKGIGQNGVNLVDKTLGTRVMTAMCCIIGEDEKERFDIRRKIGRVMNPAISGHLVYYNGFREYKIETGLNVGIEFGEMLKNRKMQRFEAVFYCPDPFFLDVQETVKNFLEVTPRLVFPLRIKAPGFIFSSLAGGELAIDNSGDATAPLRIVIEGPCLNPSVMNMTTGEVIRVNYDLGASQIIEITTHFANKRIRITDEYGNEENAMHYLDTSMGISFFGLMVGRNILKFGADIGWDSGRMKVYFSPRYLIV